MAKRLSFEKLNVELPRNVDGTLPPAFKAYENSPTLKAFLLDSLNFPTAAMTRDRLQHLNAIEVALNSESLELEEADFNFFKKHIEEELKLTHRGLYKLAIELVDSAEKVIKE